MNYDNLLYYMAEKNISCRKLAEITGIPQTSLSYAIRKRSKKLSAEKVYKLAAALGVDYADLVDFDELIEEVKQGVADMRWIPDEDKELEAYIRALNDRIEYTEDGARIKDDPEDEQRNKANAERFFNDTHAMAIQNKLAKAFNSMNIEGQEKAVDAVETLAKVPEYKKASQ